MLIDIYCILKATLLIYPVIRKSVTLHSADQSQINSTCDRSMTIVTVACGGRLEEAFNLVKSILMFSRCDMTFVVFVEPKDVQEAKTKLTHLIQAELFQSLRVQLVVKEAVYPEGLIDASLWKDMYTACATFRLFLPVKVVL